MNSKNAASELGLILEETNQAKLKAEYRFAQRKNLEEAELLKELPRPC